LHLRDSATGCIEDVTITGGGVPSVEPDYCRLKYMTVGAETCNTLTIERRLACPDLECDIIRNGSGYTAKAFA
jgi:hypothetical protein